MKSVRIGPALVGPGHRAFVIAEAGVNHNGDMDLARALVDAAADAGADAVKFQAFSAKRLAQANAPVADYQKAQQASLEKQSDLLSALELTQEDFQELSRHCRDRGIVFMASPFDEESLEHLVDIGVPALKLASGDISNRFLLDAAARADLPLILSSGTCTLGDIDAALHRLRTAGLTDLVLLHCVSSYPMPASQANLRAIPRLAQTFGLPTGWSDHSDGTALPVAAVALGACVVEKHLTLDRTLPGPDHKSSIDPHAFRRMVNDIRDVEAALGDGLKRPQPCEADCARVGRRSLTAATDLPAGTVLQAHHLTALRPADGISPMDTDHILGRRLLRPVATGEAITWAVLG